MLQVAFSDDHALYYAQLFCVAFIVEVRL